ncbi:MAG: T9SS type A sorting domain-containing protein [Fibrobacter sp.]|nr:T9SS type A sorting domain-containing protein [Fibrobacter sp.]
MKKTLSLLSAALVASSFAADRGIALNKTIETLEPMKGIVFWPDQAKSSKDYLGAISLEFSYCLPCAVVTGKTGDKLNYDWSSFEKMLNDVASRGHQAIVRFRIEYPSETIRNASGCTQNVKGATAVPLYIKAMDGYKETFSENPGGDGPTFYADWSSTELMWFYKQFYTDFAAAYDKDPRIAFVQVGFGHWGEYHIYGTTKQFGVNFATKDYQAEFLKHVAAQFTETPWSVSIDAADKQYSPVVERDDLLALNFGLFDDSFMHAKHEISQGGGNNEGDWKAMGLDRWKTAPGGGEVSYYTEKDQQEFLNPDGLYGFTWEQAASKYHMTYVIGNDSPRGSYATKERLYEASSFAGYKFEITAYTVSENSASVTVKNIGIAPLYHNAYVTIKGKRSETSLKGLIPGEEIVCKIEGLNIDASENPEPTITSDKLLEGKTIPYQAKLEASAPVESSSSSEIKNSSSSVVASSSSNVAESSSSVSEPESSSSNTPTVIERGVTIAGNVSAIHKDGSVLNFAQTAGHAIVITDMQGKVLVQKNGLASFNTNRLPRGHYIVHYRSASLKETMQIVVH